MNYFDSEMFTKHGPFGPDLIQDHLAWTKYLCDYFGHDQISSTFGINQMFMDNCSLSNYASFYYILNMPCLPPGMFLQ